ncbi:hypothetical protein VQ042_24260 [Aurantimonas sp. A2-1-M11]
MSQFDGRMVGGEARAAPCVAALVRMAGAQCRLHRLPSLSCTEAVPQQPLPKFPGSAQTGRLVKDVRYGRMTDARGAIADRQEDCQMTAHPATIGSFTKAGNIRNNT